MKKLSDGIKRGILAFIGAIIAVISFLFAEKRSINKHEKLVDIDKCRRKTTPESSKSSESFSYYAFKYASEFLPTMSKRKTKKYLKQIVSRKFKHTLMDPYVFLLNIVYDYGRILEQDENKMQIIGLLTSHQKKSKPVFVKFNIESDMIVVTGLSSAKRHRDVNFTFKWLEKSCKKEHRSELKREKESTTISDKITHAFKKKGK